jgi:hypothetical protein
MPPDFVEQSLPQAAEASGWRTFYVVALTMLVAAGAWVRFSDSIAGLVPGLAAPGQAAAPSDHRVQGLLELGLIPAAASNEAVLAMMLPAGDEAALRQAVGRRRARLVRMPLFESDGGSGAMVQVEADGLTRLVQLTAQPVVLTIPMAQVGTVRFRPLDARPGGVGIGAITLTGPVTLPTLAAGQLLEVGVVAQ